MYFRGMPEAISELTIDTDSGHSVMSVKGKKVLHIDRNDHYGGSVAFSADLETTADQIK